GTVSTAAFWQLPELAFFKGASRCMIETHLYTKGYHALRYRCPLLFPQRTGETCEHEQFQKDKGCVKDINIEKGGLMCAMLDRSSPLYRAVYRQRTSAERLNSQAKARCIERPRVRQGDSVTQ